MDDKVLTKDEVKQIVGATVGVSAMIFVMAYLHNASTATGIFSKIVRRLGIAGIGWATMDIVDTHMQNWVDEAAYTVDSWKSVVEHLKKQ